LAVYSRNGDAKDRRRREELEAWQRQVEQKEQGEASIEGAE
jgi:hypothetical protein